MQSESAGWGIGEIDGKNLRILITGDGGTTWLDRTPPDVQVESQLITAAYFLNDRQGWVIFRPEDLMAPQDEVRVLRTADEGKTWLPGEPLPPAELADFFIPGELQFVNSHRGWLLVHVGAGMNHDYVNLYLTEDAGDTWSLVSDPTRSPELQGCAKQGMSMTESMGGLIAADCQGVIDGALIFRTGDRGERWEEIALPPPKSAPTIFDDALCSSHSPFLAEDGRGFLLVECQPVESGLQHVSFLYQSTDSGQNWTASPFPGDQISFVDGSHLWAVGETIRVSRDGGMTWNEGGVPPWMGAFDSASIELGWIIEPADGSSLARTSDSGNSWSVFQPVLTPE